MERFTKALDNSNYFVNTAEIQHDANGYSGDAVNKLAKFENMYDDLLSQQSKISKELEELRNEGKMNSVKFKQLLVNKMNNNNFLILLKTYGLE